MPEGVAYMARVLAQQEKGVSLATAGVGAGWKAGGDGSLANAGAGAGWKAGGDGSLANAGAQNWHRRSCSATYSNDPWKPQPCSHSYSTPSSSYGERSAAFASAAPFCPCSSWRSPPFTTWSSASDTSSRESMVPSRFVR